MTRLKKRYHQEIVPKLMEEFKLKSSFAVPRIKKVVVNMGVTDPADPKARWKVIDSIVEQFKVITGQKPQITIAKKSIASFSLRIGDPVGVMVTLRGKRMWIFLDKLISITLPRVKDFQGVSLTAFDGQGNYSLGLEEQIVFPEVDYDLIDRVRGLQVVIVTHNKHQELATRLLELLGLPFAKKIDQKENK